MIRKPSRRGQSSEATDHRPETPRSPRRKPRIGETVILDSANDLITDLQNGHKIGGKGLILMNNAGERAVKADRLAAHTFQF